MAPTFINADVDAKSFDLDYRKTIPLGGLAMWRCGDECCDPCGCGDACCAPACPAWDITWSGGLRFADVNWNRNYLAVDDSDERFRETRSTLSFDGGGPRVGLEGRRYFGMKQWCSVFLKGDISVLLGQMSQQVQRIDESDLLTTQTARGRRIIPVTDIEAGASAQLTQYSMLSAGYLFSAWHDLGFRDQFNFVTPARNRTTTMRTSWASMASSCGWKWDIENRGLADQSQRSSWPRRTGHIARKRSRRLRRGRPQSGGRPFFRWPLERCRRMNWPPRNSVRGDEAIAAGAALGAKASAALGLARLFVEFADPHFFLDAAALDELAEAADRLLGRFFVS